MSLSDLIAHDPLVSQNFFLEIDGKVITTLSSVSGLDIEVEVASISQVGPDGKIQMIRTLANQTKAPDLQLTRMAPIESEKDAMWKWFNEIRHDGMLVKNRAKSRKHGSIVIYDTANKEAARFNFYNAWPSKISTDQLSSDSNDPVKETIVLQCERLERIS